MQAHMALKHKESNVEPETKMKYYSLHLNKCFPL